MLILALTWFFTTVALFILLWGFGRLIQAYFYENVAEQFVIRSVIAAILLSSFYTYWVYVNTRAEHKDQYGVLYDFTPTSSFDTSEFVAIRQYPNQKFADDVVKEERVIYRRSSLGRTIVYRDENNQRFKKNDTNFLTIAIELKDSKGETVRLDAVMQAPLVYAYPSGRSIRFAEANGKRFVEEEYPGRMYSPSTSALVKALLLNFANFLIWVVAFWPCLRFSFWHSVGGAICCGLIMMLLFVPLLFAQNEPKKIFTPAAIQLQAPAQPNP